MITEQRSRIARNAARQRAFQDKPSVVTDHVGRLIQIALALYLIPALLVVLAVGGLGIIMVSLGRLVTGPVHGPLG